MQKVVVRVVEEVYVSTGGLSQGKFHDCDDPAAARNHGGREGVAEASQDCHGCSKRGAVAWEAVDRHTSVRAYAEEGGAGDPTSGQNADGLCVPVIRVSQEVAALEVLRDIGVFLKGGVLGVFLGRDLGVLP